MLDKNRPIQTGIGLVFLAIGLFFVCLHLWETRNATVQSFDLDVKIALGFIVAGILLLPLDLSNFREAWTFWRKKDS